MSDNGKVILALLTGVVAGAALGFLFAPDKGEKTRKKIAGKSSDIAEEVIKKATEILETASGKLSDVRSKGSQYF